MDSTKRNLMGDQSRIRNESFTQWLIPLFVVGLLGIVGVAIV